MDKKRVIVVFFILTAIYGMGLAFTDPILSNFFRDVYNADAQMRGIIEFPREMPGVISMFLISSIAFMGNYRVGIISQVLVVIGALIMGLTTPSFNVVLVALFVYSLGFHLFLPVQDAIALSIFQDEKNIGRRMGQYKACTNAFTLIASVIVYLGFHYDVFSFMILPRKTFILTGIFSVLTIITLFILLKEHKIPREKREKFKILYRKEYNFYYILSILYGTQKQIILVFGPWVLIELLNQKASTIALLTILSSLASTFFLNVLGKWIDKFGIRKIMYADAFSFIGVYIVYGIITLMIVNNKFANLQTAIILSGILFIADRISTNIGVIRNIYLNSIAVEKSDITKTLTVGMGLDHIVTVLAAPVTGFIWDRFGPHYVFFFAAFLSVGNLIVAKKANIKV